MSEMGNGIYITPDAGGTQLGIIFYKLFLTNLGLIWHDYLSILTIPLLLRNFFNNIKALFDPLKVTYVGLAEPFVDFTYNIILKRRPLYLILNIVFPTILFSLLSCAVFYLPADECEKITLCISVLLSLVTFFLVIVDSIPQTASAVPKVEISWILESDWMIIYNLYII